MKRALNIVI